MPAFPEVKQSPSLSLSSLHSSAFHSLPSPVLLGPLFLTGHCRTSDISPGGVFCLVSYYLLKENAWTRVDENWDSHDKAFQCHELNWNFSQRSRKDNPFAFQNSVEIWNKSGDLPAVRQELSSSWDPHPHYSEFEVREKDLQRICPMLKRENRMKSSRRNSICLSSHMYVTYALLSRHAYTCMCTHICMYMWLHVYKYVHKCAHTQLYSGPRVLCLNECPPAAHL